jgi:16S rRNA (cytosine1402-N4)-methyltransferase
MVHIPVLLKETMDGLDIKSGDIYVDGTLGGGGHTEYVLQKFGRSVKIYGIDLDEDAIARSREHLTKYNGDITYILGSFRDVHELLVEYGVTKVDKILFDIGMSSNQLEESGRGFAFRSNEPLNMSFKKEVGQSEYTAYDIVNSWDEDSLRTIIKSYGEEKFAGRIVKGIVRARDVSPIQTTTDLVNVILASTPISYHRQKIHPATRTFQALRITVNDELYALIDGMKNGFDLLNTGGRMAVISFHSLEDRIVKDYFKTIENLKEGVRITKKPIIASQNEISLNPRSRSAKLRIIQKHLNNPNKTE